MMDLYCKIFIDTYLEYNEVYESVKNFICGQKQAVSFMISDWCSLSIRRNREYISESSDFLYWKFIVDIEPQENVSDNFYIDKIKKLMLFLKQKHNAVCACDFEELL